MVSAVTVEMTFNKVGRDSSHNSKHLILTKFVQCEHVLFILTLLIKLSVGYQFKPQDKIKFLG